jgi:hypothetical protein
MMRFVQQSAEVSSHLCNFPSSTEPLALLVRKRSVGGLAAPDAYETEELRRFLELSEDVQWTSATGIEPFPGELLKPTWANVRIEGQYYEHLVAYYNAAYELRDFVGPFGRQKWNTTIVSSWANQFGRLRIGSEIFGSAISPRHRKNSFVLSKWIQRNDEVDVWPGQVQFFLSHKVSRAEPEHILAYVRWYAPVQNADIRFRMSPEGMHRRCVAELWRRDFMPDTGHCFIPVHRILCRFVHLEYLHKRTELMTVVPLNRKINF